MFIEVQANAPKSRVFLLVAFSGVEESLEFEFGSHLILLAPVSEEHTILLDDGFRLWVSLGFVSLRILPSILSETPLSMLRN